MAAWGVGRAGRAVSRRRCQGGFPSVLVARRVVGHWLRLRWSQGVERRVMAREETGGNKNPGFLLPCYACAGKKKGKQCRSKRHRLVSPFFKKKKNCMKPRRFGENAPFHSNVAPETRQCSHQSPNYFCSFQLRPCQFRSSPP